MVPWGAPWQRWRDRTGQDRAGQGRQAQDSRLNPRTVPLEGRKRSIPSPGPSAAGWSGASAPGALGPFEGADRCRALLAQRPGQPRLQCQQQRVPPLDSVAARASTTSSRTTTATAAAGKRHSRGEAIACNDQAAMTMVVVVMMITSSSVLSIGLLHQASGSGSGVAARRGGRSPEPRQLRRQSDGQTKDAAGCRLLPKPGAHGFSGC